MVSIDGTRPAVLLTPCGNKVESLNSLFHCVHSRPVSLPRTSVVFRDPREVVISEHRMRIEVYHWARKTAELNPFIYERFEVHIIGGKTGVKLFVLPDRSCVNSQYNHRCVGAVVRERRHQALPRLATYGTRPLKHIVVKSPTHHHGICCATNTPCAPRQS